MNRRYVVSDPKGNEAACEDFILTVTEALGGNAWKSRSHAFRRPYLSSINPY